jgi:hypothetical protein
LHGSVALFPVDPVRGKDSARLSTGVTKTSMVFPILPIGYERENALQ